MQACSLSPLIYSYLRTRSQCYAELSAKNTKRIAVGCIDGWSESDRRVRTGRAISRRRLILIIERRFGENLDRTERVAPPRSQSTQLPEAHVLPKSVFIRVSWRLLGSATLGRGRSRSYPRDRRSAVR